jgi:hypothetical protein
VPWQLWTTVHAHELPRVIAGGYGPYAATLIDAIRVNGPAYATRVAAYNLADLARPIGAVFAPGAGPGGRALAVAAVVLLLCTGGVQLARRAPATALFLLGYAAIVIAWPYTVDRFLWGVWPLLLITLGAGTAVALRGLADRHAARGPLAGYGALAAAALLLAVGLVRYNTRGYRQQWWDTAQRAAAREILPLVEWVERSTSPEDVIASDGDPLVYLYTGRHTVPTTRWAAEAYPGAPDSTSRVADLRTLLAAYPVRYLLLLGARSASAPATAALSQGLRPRIQLLTALPGGGAAFTTTPDAKRE